MVCHQNGCFKKSMVCHQNGCFKKSMVCHQNGCFKKSMVCHQNGRAIAFAHSLGKDRQILALRDENRMPNDRNGVQDGDLTIPLEQDRLIRSKCDCHNQNGCFKKSMVCHQNGCFKKSMVYYACSLSATIGKDSAKVLPRSSPGLATCVWPQCTWATYPT